ncbi:unnamed protein product [Oppiella nova]|uniref:Uncharacterized protein n=1 Tax=Oppiella nova TaxID=334625 RepID=A0A7R9QWA6_9ACAR|nr:unnamed protein product [Oppiella nova]CAG2177444.1 unnamed protein product [Oppiella nova]
MPGYDLSRFPNLSAREKSEYTCRNLNIKCDFWDNGCVEVIKLEDLIQHTAICEHNEAKRPKTCDRELLKDEKFRVFEMFLNMLQDDSKNDNQLAEL